MRKKFIIPAKILFIAYLATTIPIVALLIGNHHCRNTFLNTASHYRSKIDPPQTVHIGDSITAGGGQWSLRLGLSPVDAINLAGNGYTVNQIRSQAKKAVQYDPEIICVMAGTNDLVDLRFDQEFTISQYDLLLRVFSEAQTPCVVTLIPYQSTSKHTQRITNLNAALKGLCEKYGCFVIDLNPEIAPMQTLQSQFTSDGIHLTEDAYDLWASKINDAISEIRGEKDS